MPKGRPKPLHGAKKYDRAILNCTARVCTNPERDKDTDAKYRPCGTEFFVSRASTPAKRYCRDHMPSRANPPAHRNPEINAQYRVALKALGILR
jgi:hypothetical protein